MGLVVRATGSGSGYLPHSRIRVLATVSSSSSLRLSATSQLLICKSKFPSAASSPISTPVHLEQFSLTHLSHSNSTSQNLEARMALVKLDATERQEKLQPLINKGWNMVKDR